MNTNDLNDDLSDLLGLPAGTAKPLPIDPGFARIRDAVPDFTETCPKCRGRGRFISYAGRDCGSCFGCKGKGKLTFRTAPEARAKAKAARDALPGKRWAAWTEANPIEAAWLAAKIADSRVPAGYREFLTKMRSAVEAYGDLTPGQLEAVRKGVARDASYAETKAQAATVSNPRSQEVDASKIVEAIAKGKASGLKWVCLRFVGAVISEAKRHPGTLYVKGDGVYLGKIANGVFSPSRDCTPEQQAAIVLIASDPAAAAKVYGMATNSCCVCGRELTNAESVTTGIGPICSGRLGFTPGGIKVFPAIEG